MAVPAVTFQLQGETGAAGVPARQGWGRARPLLRVWGRAGPAGDPRRPRLSCESLGLGVKGPRRRGLAWEPVSEPTRAHLAFFTTDLGGGRFGQWFQALAGGGAHSLPRPRPAGGVLTSASQLSPVPSATSLSSCPVLPVILPGNSAPCPPTARTCSSPWSAGCSLRGRRPTGLPNWGSDATAGPSPALQPCTGTRVCWASAPPTPRKATVTALVTRITANPGSPRARETSGLEVRPCPKQPVPQALPCPGPASLHLPLPRVSNPRHSRPGLLPTRSSLLPVPEALDLPPLTDPGFRLSLRTPGSTALSSPSRVVASPSRQHACLSHLPHTQPSGRHRGRNEGLQGRSDLPRRILVRLWAASRACCTRVSGRERCGPTACVSAALTPPRLKGSLCRQTGAGL
ncbi:uncharacterized protein [Oryctolagus cuniculus]|uniref:uncharacterized protein n=1 Tax=Oryctolagus cuniculus TaxID=9986 RepID=UPI00387940BB